MHNVVFTVEVIHIHFGLSSLHSLDKVLCGKYLNMVDVNELTMANFLVLFIPTQGGWNAMERVSSFKIFLRGN